MTKYILNSGGTSSYPKKASEFFNEIIRDLGDKPKILFCFFAQKREDWEEKFEKYKNGFMEKVKGVKPKFELAFPDKFINQVKNSNAIIIFGGDDILLQYWLRKFDLTKIFKNKVVATSSAGSNAIVDSSWTCDWRKCIDGLGVLSIKFISHYKSTEYAKDDPRGPIDWDAAYKELQSYGNKSLPIHALEEGDFIILKN